MTQNRHTTALHSIAELERDLQKVRQRTLIATRRGDFYAVARLTNEARRLGDQMNSVQHVEGKVTSGSDLPIHPTCPTSQEHP